VIAVRDGRTTRRCSRPNGAVTIDSKITGGEAPVRRLSAQTVRPKPMSVKIGQRVRLKSTGEVGVVVWVWEDAELGTDTYVAFFGDDWPEGKPAEKPYILRYLEPSLELIND
jgi:hypothetical protein